MSYAKDAITQDCGSIPGGLCDLGVKPNASPAQLRRALWGKALRQRDVWGRALKIGFGVGLLQAAVNQGDIWLRDTVSAGVIVKTLASPLISLLLVLFTSAATWVQKTLEANET
jgi:hypothetical protein